MSARRMEGHPVVRQEVENGSDLHVKRTARLLPVTIPVAGLLAASLVWATGPTVAVVGGALALWAGFSWVRLLARHDARARLVLWLVFLLNATLARMLPDPWGTVAGRLDDGCLAVALAVVLLT